MNDFRVIENPKEVKLENGAKLSEMKISLGNRIKEASGGKIANITSNGEIIDIDSLLKDNIKVK